MGLQDEIREGKKEAEPTRPTGHLPGFGPENHPNHKVSTLHKKQVKKLRKDKK